MRMPLPEGVAEETEEWSMGIRGSTLVCVSDEGGESDTPWEAGSCGNIKSLGLAVSAVKSAPSLVSRVLLEVMASNELDTVECAVLVGLSGPPAELTPETVGCAVLVGLSGPPAEMTPLEAMAGTNSAVWSVTAKHESVHLQLASVCTIWLSAGNSLLTQKWQAFPCISIVPVE